ncbi:MAG: alpha/beta hydrolase [Acidimicrobiaceae bacterium]
MLDHEQLISGTSHLELRIATGSSTASSGHILILMHGLPRTMGMGRQAAGLLPELAEHLANESGWTVATGTLSGVGTSTGTFSASQWKQDITTVVERMSKEKQRISLAGFGFGGALALNTAANDERVQGVATFAAPAHLPHWSGSAEELHRGIKIAGVVSDAVALQSVQELYDDVLSVDPLGSVAKIPPRRLLIGHGSDDIEVPTQDARDLVDAAQQHAELRIIQGAGHQMRADPRMVATLLGWLDRH